MVMSLLERLFDYLRASPVAHVFILLILWLATGLAARCASGRTRTLPRAQPASCARRCRREAVGWSVGRLIGRLCGRFDGPTERLLDRQRTAGQSLCGTRVLPQHQI